MVQDIEDKNKIVKFFVNEVIYHETDLGVDRGWPSLQGIDIKTHINEVHNRLDALNTAKANNLLYTNTEGYRSRASSGAIEDIKERILGSVMYFIGKNFGLRKNRLEELGRQLGELTLGVDESKFRREIIKVVQKHCRLLDVDPEEIQELQRILLLNKEQERKMGGVL